MDPLRIYERLLLNCEIRQLDLPVVPSDAGPGRRLHHQRQIRQKRVK